jgi:hypothetical protein
MKRECPGGYAYYLLNRAYARATLFHKAGDYAAFLRVLAQTQRRHPLRLLAYCVIPNPRRLLLWPQADGQVSVFRHYLTLTHTQRPVVRPCRGLALGQPVAAAAPGGRGGGGAGGGPGPPPGTLGPLGQRAANRGGGAGRARVRPAGTAVWRGGLGPAHGGGAAPGNQPPPPRPTAQESRGRPAERPCHPCGEPTRPPVKSVPDTFFCLTFFCLARSSRGSDWRCGEKPNRV